MKSINGKRQMVEMFFGFRDNINYGCDYNKLKHLIEIRDVLGYLNKGEQECENSDILYALGASCKVLDEKYGRYVGNEKWNAFIDVRLMKGCTFPTISIGFRIVEK